MIVSMLDYFMFLFIYSILVFALCELFLGPLIGACMVLFNLWLPLDSYGCMNLRLVSFHSLV
jgi:hypothetical protein